MKRLAVLLLAVATSLQAQEVRDALRAGDLICEFRDGFRARLLADLDASPPGPDLMLMYDSVTADSAHVISTARPGRRPVVVRSVADAVHLIEPEGPSIRVTTLTRCEKLGVKDGRCVRFAARHAWHFDANAYLGPDIARARLPSAAAVGVCERWDSD